MQEFLHHAKSLALEAGDVISRSFRIGHEFDIKTDLSPVTKADQEVNDLVIARLSVAFPEHSLLGEEGMLPNGSEYVWVFDPIDGTAAFLRGIPTNVFSIALVRDGEPILGVVHDPHTGRLYHAVAGEGAYLNDEPLGTAAATGLAGSFVEVEGRAPFRDLAFFERLRQENARFLSYHSTVYGQMLVASGQIEGAVYAGDKPWDQAAAKIIIEEAGGVTSSLTGAPQRYDGPIEGFISACTPEYHAHLAALIAPSLA